MEKIKQKFKLKYPSINQQKLNEYVTFIKDNSSKIIKHKTANHHILPRALFPEYCNLKEHKWNSCVLLNDDHYIAHKLLFEMLPDNISTASAWYAMNNKNYSNTNDPIKLIGKKTYGHLLEQRNILVSNNAKGKVMCRGTNGNNLKVSKKRV